MDSHRTSDSETGFTYILQLTVLMLEKTNCYIKVIWDRFDSQANYFTVLVLLKLSGMVLLPFAF